MDKYEYKLKTEQMLELMEDGAYGKAAAIADTIDWRRVRNTTMLANVSDIYEKNRDYQKSYEVLNIAYHRAEGSRKIVSRLCTLALKTRNVDEAIDYYDEFIQIAPKDPNQHILKYQILRAQRAPIEQQIHALEEFKKAEYIEEWAYELAKLYQEAGMTAECLEECDDLILWFSEGKYVYQAMELKMQYKPLTPSQQEKYDRRYEKVSGETEEMPNLMEYQAAQKASVQAQEPSGENGMGAGGTFGQETVGDGGNIGQESLSQVRDENLSADEVLEEPEEPKPAKRKIGNTMKLDEALKSLLNIHLNDGNNVDGDSEAEEEQIEEQTADLSELKDAIEEIESVADMDLAAEISEKRRMEAIKVDPDLEELRPEPEEGEEIEELEEAEPEELEESEALELAEAEDMEEFEEPEALELAEAEDTEELEESEDLELAEAEDIEDSEGVFDPVEAEELEEPEEFGENIEQEDQGAIQAEVEEMEEEIQEEPEELVDFGEPEELDEPEESEQAEELERLEEPEDLEDLEDFDEAFLYESGKEEDMNEKKNGTVPILSPDIQRLIDEIEGNIPASESIMQEEKKVEKETYTKPEVLENRGVAAEELRIDDASDEFEDFDDVLDEDEYEDLVEEDDEYVLSDEEAESYEEDFEEELDEDDAEADEEFFAEEEIEYADDA